jgi:diguanylate cyclase (GGDEF)-like protein/PAS domain S-box-containing protein
VEALLFRSTFEAASVGLAHVALDGTIVRVNRAFSAIAGLPADDIVGVASSSLMLPDDGDGARFEQLRSAVASGELDVARFEQPANLSGRQGVVEVTLRALTDRAGRPEMLLAELCDVTERLLASRAPAAESVHLAELIAFQRDLAPASGDLERLAAVLCDQAHTITGGDGASIAVLDGDALVYVAEDGERGHGLGFRLGFESLAGHAVRDRRTLVCADTHTDARVDQTLIRRLGSRSLVCVPIFAGPRPIGVFMALAAAPRAFSEVSVSRLEMLAALAAPSLAGAVALEIEAYRDALTGLANRDRLELRLDALLAAPWNPTTAAVVLLDIKDFRSVNDRLGHDVGDRVLACVGRRLAAAAEPDELPARLAFDRFAVVLPQMRGIGEARARAAEIVRAVAGPLDSDITVEFAVGTAVADTTGVDAALLLGAALDDLVI